MAEVPHIKVDGLTVRYRAKSDMVVALEDVSVEIPPRSFVSVVGPSGCGKTTLLKVLSGVLRPSAGQVLFDGVPLGVADLAGKIGYVFQRPLLLPWRTALENVALTSEIARKALSREERLAEARKWLALTGLGGFEDRLPHELSGGMQQRVSLSRALAFHPPILMMDEPFAALDEFTREKLDDDLLALWEAENWTVIFVTHSVYESVYLSERVLVMGARPGRILRDLIIDAPHPRDREFRTTPEYVKQCAEISEALRHDVKA